MNISATNNITHQDSSSQESFDLAPYQEKIKTRGDATFSVDENLKMLEEVSEFELGRFLLKNKGLNGYWTAYIILHALHKKDLSPLEEWIIHKAPAVKATRERFHIFQNI